MAIKITLMSFPCLIILAIVISYFVNAQKDSLYKNNNEIHQSIKHTEETYEPLSLRSSFHSIYSNSFILKPSSIIHKPTFICPSGTFKCSIKSNSLFQIRSRIKGFVCINDQLVCDGNIDCANNEDELNCNKNDETITDEIEDCYLCQNTSGLCISKENLCDGIPDCPLEDDETRQECSTLNKNLTKISSLESVENKQESQKISLLESRKNQANINISILNQRDLNNKNSEDLNRKLKSSSSRKDSVNNVGFKFQVENFIIYNSQVSMFNQNMKNSQIDRNKKESNLDQIKQQH